MTAFEPIALTHESRAPFRQTGPVRQTVTWVLERAGDLMPRFRESAALNLE
jgi:hypothetical protein